MATHYEVVESFGYGHRAGIRINESTAPRVLAGSTVRGLIRELKGWANGYADSVHEVNSGGARLITATHWVNGFENVRQLRIRNA
jgi:hypothetical protein